MTSKESLDNIRDYHNEIVIDNYCSYTENIFEEELDIIEKDLEILECFRKIPIQDLKNFIDEQIRYEINLNSWLKSCNCDLEKEELTKHLIKIKEWLENVE